VIMFELANMRRGYAANRARREEVAGQDWGWLTRSNARCEQSLRRQEIKNSCDAKRTKRTRLSTTNAAVGRATKWKTFVEMLTRGGGRRRRRKQWAADGEAEKEN
jgi:hypothetical protein